MCEDCESEIVPHASYAEKRKLIRARWRPANRRDFTAEPVSARPQRAGDLDFPDEPRSMSRASRQS